MIRASVDAVVRSMPSPAWASPLRHCFQPAAAVAGDRYAPYHAEFANAACGRFERLLPPDNLDWNDVLNKGRG